jgi:RNA polymerase sigma-70 factor (ECF subfamily)
MGDGNGQQLVGESSSNETSGQTVQIQRLLDRLQGGDENARNELIECSCARLERLTRKMLRNWEGVHRWEQTCDVLQNALMRLYRSLAETRPPKAVDFFRLAALNIRRELHDLARHYYGPRGEGNNHATMGLNRGNGDDLESPMAAFEGAADENPAHLAAWAEFHEQVGQLPDEERELFDLLWYQELSQSEAAELLSVSERTVKRRWAAARLRLHEVLSKTLPDFECITALA